MQSFTKYISPYRTFFGLKSSLRNSVDYLMASCHCDDDMPCYCFVVFFFSPFLDDKDENVTL